MPHQALRPLRSFVRREGRITPAQQRALAEQLPRFAWPDQPQPIAPVAVFGRVAPLVIEIGFGNGDNVFAQALAHPEQDFLGLEVHRPGVGALLQQVDAAGLNNVRVSTKDAMEFMPSALPPGAADVVQIFFPDPWPKKRHHKRRLVRDNIMDLVARVLRPGGRLLLATDWENYAVQMLTVLNAHPEFENQMPAGGYAPRCERVKTRFERRAERLGHVIRDLEYRRR